MAPRGRKSSASLAVKMMEPLQVIPRLRPPHDLNDEEVEVWSAVVENEAADWFAPSNVPLLTQYCRHVIQARRVGELIERATSDPALEIQDYNRLLTMQERESRAIASLATKMRVSQQATTNHRGNKQSAPTKKPWQG